MEGLRTRLKRSSRPEVEQEQPTAPPLEIQPLITESTADEDVTGQQDQETPLIPQQDQSLPSEDVCSSSTLYPQIASVFHSPPSDKPQLEQQNTLYPNVKNFFTGLLGRSAKPNVSEEQATAPPLTNDPSSSTGEGKLKGDEGQTGFTLPYVKCVKEDKVKTWEKGMDFDVHMKGDKFTSRDLRCAVCFNAMSSDESVVCYQEKVSF